MADKSPRNELEKRSQALEEETQRLRCRITALEKREQSNRIIIDSIDDGVFEISQRGRLGLFNEAIRRLTGYSDGELADMPFQNLMPSASSQRLEDLISDISQTGEPGKLEHCELKSKDGDAKEVDLLIHPIFDETDKPKGFYGLAKHNNSQKDTERELESAREQLEDMNDQLEVIMERVNRMALEGEITSIELNQIFNTSGDGMWVVDKDFTVQRINETLLASLGRTSNDVIGKRCYETLSCTLCRTPECPMQRLKQGAKRVEYDTERNDENGGTRSFILTATPFRDFGDEFMGIVEAFKDITERKAIEEALHRANSELERLATIDGLTQVANRRFFNERFKAEWSRLARESLPLSLIMCDLDFFKHYNDRYGHLLGDDCLRAVAGTMKKNATRPADLVARYGGEEFVIMLPNTPSHGALRVAELVRQYVEDLRISHETSSVNDFVTMSLGVATVVPDTGSDPTTLIKAADGALYEAKEQGRNRLVVTCTG